MRINKVEELLGVSRATIRYYEEQGLLAPTRTESGYRDYSDEDVMLFQKIIVLRKLGVGVPEIKALIDNKAELHAVLAGNLERLKAQQSEIASAIDMCEELEADADDFESIDPPKYLKTIYEAERKGSHFPEAKEISYLDLNLSIALIGALCGVAVPQNNRMSARSLRPIPEDVRGNKKEGDEYDTIGDVLRKGGKRKVVVYIFAGLMILLGVLNGLCLWGGLGSALKYGFDYNKLGMLLIDPDGDVPEEIAEIDPEAVSDDWDDKLFKFHTMDCLVLSVKHANSGVWSEIDRKIIDAKEGYLFVTGNPSSEIEIHVIADGTCNKYSIKTNDSTFSEEKFVSADSSQIAIKNEIAIVLFCRDADALQDIELDYVGEQYDKIFKDSPDDDCYAITAKGTK